MAKPAILVVEDDVDILRLITYNLEASGFDVATAQDGYEALALARRRAPELVILDLMLPGLDGLEVCKELKRSEATRKIPVLMLTARGPSRSCCARPSCCARTCAASASSECRL